MNTRFLIGTPVAAVAALSISFALALGAPAQEKKHDPKSETPLAQQMERIDDAMHKLKRGVRDAAQKDACLTEVANAQQACLAAKLLTPKMAPTVPEAERAAFVRDFRKGVAALLVEFTNLEIALLDGDAEKSVATYKKLEAMEDEGHNRFTNE